jgi:solute:Na+ symporter, SSS family
VSLLVKIGALAFVIFLPTQYAINLQLLGGVWILQTFPAIVFGLYTRWFHHLALLLGWLVAMVVGTGMAWSTGFKSPLYPLHLGGRTILAYAALEMFVLNIVIAIVGTWVFDALRVPRMKDETAGDAYEAEEGTFTAPAVAAAR